MLESILNFILSILKLSTNKILIAILGIGLTASVYYNRILLEKLEADAKSKQAQIDTLTSTILRNEIRFSEKELKSAEDRHEKDLEFYRRLNELPNK